MTFRLKFWNWPKDNSRYNPFLSQFDDMPLADFVTLKEAIAAAETFVAKYADKTNCIGGYDKESELYYIRDEVMPDQYRMTNFVITSD